MFGLPRFIAEKCLSFLDSDDLWQVYKINTNSREFFDRTCIWKQRSEKEFNFKSNENINFIYTYFLLVYKRKLQEKIKFIPNATGIPCKSETILFRNENYDRVKKVLIGYGACNNKILYIQGLYDDQYGFNINNLNDQNLLYITINLPTFDVLHNKIVEDVRKLLIIEF